MVAEATASDLAPVPAWVHPRLAPDVIPALRAKHLAQHHWRQRMISAARCPRCGRTDPDNLFPVEAESVWYCSWCDRYYKMKTVADP